MGGYAEGGGWGDEVGGVVLREVCYAGVGGVFGVSGVSLFLLITTCMNAVFILSLN